ncbi:hypothetical protein Tco_0999056, partial [Tanacetum coccineum]
MGNVKKSLAERTRHKRQYDRRMNERQMQSRESKVVSSKALDASLVVTECSGTKYQTRLNDQVPFAEVQLTAQHNVLANEQQHTEQSEPIYDTYLLEKVDSNTTPDSTNMCHRGGEIDQDAEQYQAKSPLFKLSLPRSSSIDDVCSHQFRPIKLLMSVQASLFNDKWRLLTTLQAPFLKEKKGVRFSALYLRKKKNLLVFDHSYQHDSCFFHARIVIKWIY